MTTTLTSNSWTLTNLSELVADTRSGFASGARDDAGTVQVRMNNVDTSGMLDLTQAIRVPASSKQIEEFGLRLGDVLFNNTNSTDLVGKTAVFTGHNEPVVFSNHFTRIRVKPDILDARYLGRWLTYQQQRKVFTGLCTRWVNQSAVRADKLLGLKIPLPTLADQERIADILDKADAIRRKRQEARNATSDMPLAAFREIFRDYLNSDAAQRLLSDTAEVVSGVAKGRKLNGAETQEVPYLRVANVQAGYLDLSEIKTIPAKDSEVKELALQQGDVVMTEGGDHDKLGRGALWEHDVPNCIHQNHVFRVRTDRQKLLPTFFVYFLQTEVAKGYFLRCAKKTTNLASINMTQLRALPVPQPPLKLQERFHDELTTIRDVIGRQNRAQTDADSLFHSLVQRAFKREL